MMHAKKLLAAMVVVGAISVAPLALAKHAGMSDASFVTKASAAGMTEVQASQLADAHAQSADIKSFASTMITDHTKAGDELKAAAQKNNFTPSDGPNAMQQKAITHLATLNGAAFDKAYAAMMLKDHNEAVALFKGEAAHGQNSDLKSFAGETLPTLEHHLEMAKQLK
jgi:putative membrane protein